jgi:hypothetical protein
MSDVQVVEKDAEVQHVEISEALKDGQLVESVYVGLTTYQTVRRLWRAILFCFMGAFAATFDGFHYALPGKCHDETDDYCQGAL